MLQRHIASSDIFLSSEGQKNPSISIENVKAVDDSSLSLQQMYEWHRKFKCCNKCDLYSLLWSISNGVTTPEIGITVEGGMKEDR